MDINLNATLNRRIDSNRLERTEHPSTTSKPENVVRQGLEGPALTVSSKTVSLLDGIDNVQDIDLRRDDDLGQLMGKAFTFQPPEMPNFI